MSAVVHWPNQLLDGLERNFIKSLASAPRPLVYALPRVDVVNAVGRWRGWFLVIGESSSEAYLCLGMRAGSKKAINDSAMRHEFRILIKDVRGGLLLDRKHHDSHELEHAMRLTSIIDSADSFAGKWYFGKYNQQMSYRFTKIVPETNVTSMTVAVKSAQKHV